MPGDKEANTFNAVAGAFLPGFIKKYTGDNVSAKPTEGEINLVASILSKDKDTYSPAIQKNIDTVDSWLLQPANKNIHDQVHAAMDKQEEKAVKNMGNISTNAAHQATAAGRNSIPPLDLSSTSSSSHSGDEAAPSMPRDSRHTILVEERGNSGYAKIITSGSPRVDGDYGRAPSAENTPRENTAGKSEEAKPYESPRPKGPGR